MFYSLTSPRKVVSVPPGSAEAAEYTYKIDSDGHKVFYKSGSYNLYDKIQESAPLVDINLLISRYSAQGYTEEDLLNHFDGMLFADVSGAPQTLSQALNSVIGLTQVFDDLPLEIRENFDFSASKFISEYGSAGFAEKMKTKKQKAVEAFAASTTPTPSVPEVKTDA